MSRNARALRDIPKTAAEETLHTGTFSILYCNHLRISDRVFNLIVWSSVLGLNCKVILGRTMEIADTEMSRKIQAKCRNREALQVKFDGVVRETVEIAGSSETFRSIEEWECRSLMGSLSILL